MSANAYADFLQTLNPLVYYKLDETSGTAITDYGPFGLDGTLSGSALANVTTGIEQFDSMLDFNGTDHIITLPTTQDNSLIEQLLAHVNYTGIYSINWWSRWDDVGGSGRAGIIGNVYDSADGYGWGVFFNDDTSTNAVTIRVSGDTGSAGLNMSTAADASLVMYTLTGDGTTVRLYKDSVSSFSGAVAVRQGFVDADAVSIGAIENNGTTYYLDGLIGQVSVHNRELTQAEITQLYNLGANARTIDGNLKVNGAAVQHNVIVLDRIDGRVAGTGVGDGSGDYSIDASTDNPVYVIDWDDYGDDWIASTAYSLNDIVHPTTANGYYYVCTTAGTSDSTEPTWPTSGTVADNTAVWTATEYTRPRIHGPIEVV